MKLLLLLLSTILLGVCSKKLDSRIFNGHSTKIDKFPYIAIIKIYSETSPGLWTWNKQCTGTIVARKLILTAAHCLRDRNNNAIHPNRTSVQVGSASSVLYSQGGTVFKVEEYMVSSNFTFSYVQRRTYSYKAYNAHDIAVLKLKTCMTFTESIQPILYFASTNPLVSSTAVVIGWGANSTFDTRLSSLKYHEVRVISTDECTKLTHVSVDKSQICTFERATGLCVGDTGSPLVTYVLDQNNTIWPMLLGIFSYTPQWEQFDGQFHHVCGLEPDVYVSIARVRSFIESAYDFKGNTDAMCN